MDKFKTRLELPAVVKVGIVIVLIIIIIFAMRQPTITVDTGGVEISGFYGKEYSIDKIISVELLDEMPNIGIRTNGMSIGPIKRGYFKVDGYGSSTLHVNTGHVAFLAVRTEDRTVFFSFDQTEEAMDIYDKILKEIN